LGVEFSKVRIRVLPLSRPVEARREEPDHARLLLVPGERPVGAGVEREGDDPRRQPLNRLLPLGPLGAPFLESTHDRIPGCQLSDGQIAVLGREPQILEQAALSDPQDSAHGRDPTTEGSG
jgi:hypothetical protein